MKTFATGPRPEKKSERPCVLCGSRVFKPRWNLGEFSFVTCGRCGLVQQNPQPDPSFVLARYDETYRDYEVERQHDYAHLERLALADLGFDAIASEIAARARSEGRAPSFLDVGCATGRLLSLLQAEGWRCAGVEPCTSAAEYGRRTYGLDIRATTLEQVGFPGASFDVVHASHVIEHLNDPASFLSEARRILRPGGKLLITTPNRVGFQARLLGARWRSVIYDHLYLFSRQDLRSLIESKGFGIRRFATWGGWAAGLRPVWIKKPLDRAAKSLGFGDVMALLCEPREYSPDPLAKEKRSDRRRRG